MSVINKLKKINWYRVAEVVGFIFITALGITIFTFMFLFGKAIVEAIF